MLEFNRDNIIAIEVRGKEWWDKLNGNSYWASVVTLTDSDHKTHVFSIEFQYGYGDFYIQQSVKILKELRYIDDCDQPRSQGVYSGGRRVIWTTSMQTGCKKRDVVAWGKDD